MFMELHRYIIMKPQIVTVPFALYVCALASREKMSSGNADTAFVSMIIIIWRVFKVLCSVPMYNVLHSIME